MLISIYQTTWCHVAFMLTIRCGNPESRSIVHKAGCASRFLELTERNGITMFTQQFGNLIQLVYVWVTREQGISTHHLSKQTAHCPDVHFSATWGQTTTTEMLNKYSKIPTENFFGIEYIWALNWGSYDVEEMWHWDYWLWIVKTGR